LQQAHGGTLFIDHVELLPLSAQVRLLDLATQGHLVAKDATQSVPSDAVLICATHSNLRAAIEAGVFDVDFYYRINGLTLQLAPLRERKDLAALVARLLEELEPGTRRRPGARGRVGLRRVTPGPATCASSTTRCTPPWPLLDDGQARIGWSHLPDDLVEELKWRVPRSAMAVGEVTENLRELSLATIERAVALAARQHVRSSAPAGHQSQHPVPASAQVGQAGRRTGVTYDKRWTRPKDRSPKLMPAATLPRYDVAAMTGVLLDSSILGIQTALR
jgi:hypothetical protein